MLCSFVSLCWFFSQLLFRLHIYKGAVVAAERQWHILGVKLFKDLCHPHPIYISHLLASPRPTSDQILIGKYSFRIVMSSHATIHVASELNTTSIGRLVNQISQEHVMLDLFGINYRCPSIRPK